MRIETVGDDRRDGPSPPLPISHRKLVSFAGTDPKIDADRANFSVSVSHGNDSSPVHRRVLLNASRVGKSERHGDGVYNRDKVRIMPYFPFGRGTEVTKSDRGNYTTE
jgi:hypothetical protein